MIGRFVESMGAERLPRSHRSTPNSVADAFAESTELKRRQTMSSEEEEAVRAENRPKTRGGRNCLRLPRCLCRICRRASANCERR